MRENERLKNDNRQSKRSHINNNVGTSFNLNVSRNVGSDRKSPISNRNKKNHSYVDEDNNGTRDILSGLHDNKSENI